MHDETFSFCRLYGTIDGAQSDWLRANFHDRGRAHLHQPAELATTGLKAWDSANAPAMKPLRYFEFKRFKVSS
jgi:hypothetical protein